MGNFSPVDQDEFKKHNQNAICDCQNFVEPISQTPVVEIHTRPKLYHFGRYLVKAKLSCRKCFVPITVLDCSYGKTFIPVTEISGSLHMSPVTGLARLPGRILWCVHMGNFSPLDRDEFKKHNQNGGT